MHFHRYFTAAAFDKIDDLIACDSSAKNINITFNSVYDILFLRLNCNKFWISVSWYDMKSLNVPFLVMSNFGNSRFISMKLILSLHFKCQTEEIQVILRYRSCDEANNEAWTFMFKLIYLINCLIDISSIFNYSW